MMAPRREPVRPPPAPRLWSRISQLSHASKRSLLSHSSSFEADDERSDTASLDYYHYFGTMNGSRSRRSSGSGRSLLSVPPPRYPGDDTRPTSSKELAGWYAYAFAAEVYVICGE